MTNQHSQEHLDLVFLYALQALPAREVPVVEAHLSTCAECWQEVESLRPIIGSLVALAPDVLRPSVSLWERLAKRVAAETGKEALLRPPEPPAKPEWEEVAAGIPARYSRRTQRETASVCWYVWHPERSIRLIDTPEWKSFTCFRAN